jgi:hypothetical protein
MSNTKGRVIEIALYFPEKTADFEPKLRQESSKSGDTRKAGPAGPSLEVLPPEEVRAARFLSPVGDCRVSHNLARAFKRNTCVEAVRKSFQKSSPGLRAREIERIENLVNGKRRGLNH